MLLNGGNLHQPLFWSCHLWDWCLSLQSGVCYFCSVDKQQLTIPRTVTCHVLSSDSLAAVTLEACNNDNGEQKTKICSDESPQIQEPNHNCSPLILAGLHACGDLSVNMLRVFVSCEQVKALVSVGCCYNLLSEDYCGDTNSCPGFPMSKAAKLSDLMLGKSTRDLACQSAERWRSLTKDIATQNFDIHAFRAAFQMVIEKFFPEISKLSPSIGRQGKALRRQRLQKVVESHIKKADDISCSALKEQKLNADGVDTSIYEIDTRPADIHHGECQKFSLFRDYTISGFDRLGCGSVDDDSLLEIWMDVQPFAEYIGPFWCLRAALGPVVETYILLDRILFLQEQGDPAETFLFPLFDPTMSPRNMAIIAWKLSAEA